MPGLLWLLCRESLVRLSKAQASSKETQPSNIEKGGVPGFLVTQASKFLFWFKGWSYF